MIINLLFHCINSIPKAADLAGKQEEVSADNNSLSSFQYSSNNIFLSILVSVHLPCLLDMARVLVIQKTHLRDVITKVLVFPQGRYISHGETDECDLVKSTPLIISWLIVRYLNRILATCILYHTMSYLACATENVCDNVHVTLFESLLMSM